MSDKPRKPTILLVEDEYLIAWFAMEALSEAGYDIVGVAQTAEKAVEMAVVLRPDLVVMDTRLHGGSDGVWAAIEILNRAGIRCLFATSNDDPENRRRGAAANPHGWLPKPYREAQLVLAVASALEKA